MDNTIKTAAEKIHTAACIICMEQGLDPLDMIEIFEYLAKDKRKAAEYAHMKTDGHIREPKINTEEEGF